MLFFRFFDRLLFFWLFDSPGLLSEKNDILCGDDFCKITAFEKSFWLFVFCSPISQYFCFQLPLFVFRLKYYFPKILFSIFFRRRFVFFIVLSFLTSFRCWKSQSSFHSTHVYHVLLYFQYLLLLSNLHFRECKLAQWLVSLKCLSDWKIKFTKICVRFFIEKTSIGVNFEIVRFVNCNNCKARSRFLLIPIFFIFPLTNFYCDCMVSLAKLLPLFKLAFSLSLSQNCSSSSDINARSKSVLFKNAGNFFGKLLNSFWTRIPACVYAYRLWG